MKIHEYQARELFQKFSIPVPAGVLVSSTEDAAAKAKDIGYPVVLKSQVLVGGRGKAGGIKIAKTSEDIKALY
ncbi:MAG: succinate--CoA ligase subunit beta, partial [Candidatus Omnitrophica bacterium CG12_big_fil_rev_8_21_14_0_65_50_5]